MRYVKIFKIFIFLAVFKINAQVAFVFSGSNATVSNGNITYTICQLVYTTNFDSTVLTSQGVQQLLEIQSVMGLNNFDTNLQFVIYPNPISDWLVIDIKDYNYEPLHYQLFDINGQLALSDKKVSDNTILKSQELSTSMYLLKVSGRNKKVNIFS